jgi:predicted PurR-regulated permease PerM
MGIILAFLFNPVYKLLLRKIKHKTTASLIVVLLVLLIIIIPFFIMVAGLVVQASTAYHNIQNINVLEGISDFASEIVGSEVDLSEYFNGALYHVKNYIINSAPDVISSIAKTLLGLFIMCFTMFYLFKDGGKLWNTIKKHFPLKKDYKEALFGEFDKITKGVLYGQIVTAIIQGGIAGIGFFIFGIPNPIFWGFIMMVLSFLPVVGAPLVWVPASVIEIIQGNYLGGVGMFIFGLVIVSNVDEIIRAKLISVKTNIHPAIILIGVIGGLHVFGLIGLVLGPLILAILIVLLKAYSRDFEKEITGEHKKQKRKSKKRFKPKTQK